MIWDSVPRVTAVSPVAPRDGGSEDENHLLSREDSAQVSLLLGSSRRALELPGCDRAREVLLPKRVLKGLAPRPSDSDRLRTVRSRSLTSPR